MWLNWLKENCEAPKYRDMIINQNNLNLLPTDGFLEVPTIETNEDIVLKTDSNLGDDDEINEEDQSRSSTNLPNLFSRGCSFHESQENQAEEMDDVSDQELEEEIDEVIHTGVFAPININSEGNNYISCYFSLYTKFKLIHLLEQGINDILKTLFPLTNNSGHNSTPIVLVNKSTFE